MGDIVDHYIIIAEELYIDSIIPGIVIDGIALNRVF